MKDQVSRFLARSAALTLALTLSLPGCAKKDAAPAVEEPKAAEPAPAEALPAECLEYKAALDHFLACDRFSEEEKAPYRNAWTSVETSSRAATSPAEKEELVKTCAFGTMDVKESAAECF